MSWRNTVAKNLGPFAALWSVNEGLTAKMRALAMQAVLIVLAIWLSDRVLAYLANRPPHDLAYLAPGFIGGVIGLIVAGFTQTAGAKK